MSPIPLTVDSRISREETLEIFRKAALSHTALLEEFPLQKEQLELMDDLLPKDSNLPLVDHC